MIYVVDTHPLVWYFNGDTRLSPAARNAIADPSAEIVVPTIVLSEITFLCAKGRIVLDPSDIRDRIRNTVNMKIHPLDESVVERLPVSLEIHDAIVVATTLVCRDIHGEEVRLVTRDQEITASRLVDVVW